MKVIVDTNVAIVANRQAPQASAACVLSCVERLLAITAGETIVLDDGWHILDEYLTYYETNPRNRPIADGDLFFKWVLDNLRNPTRCELVRITPDPERGFAEFPIDSTLSNFDPSDRKFVAVALGHPDHPPLLNAVDSDWFEHHAALTRQGVQVQFLCPDFV